MKTEFKWRDKIPERDGYPSVIHCLAFSPDGSKLLVAVGNRILLYDAVDGDLIHSLKGHSSKVYCVAFSHDGERFASGGADKMVIIWTDKCDGILRYNHNDPIQCLSFNPMTKQLASATASDFVLWSPEQQSVVKHKVTARVLCSDWTNNGQYIALGQFNGHISIRDQKGVEKLRIVRDAPVWTIRWAPPQTADNAGGDRAPDILTVGDWGKKLSFYSLRGERVGTRDVDLGFDPCCIAYYDNGRYLLIGGSNREVRMYTRSGNYLSTLAKFPAWVWAVRPRPDSRQISVGCNDGTLVSCSTNFVTVHSLHHERYAHRQTMTDVVVQHLITETKLLVRTRDYVKKIAVYKDRLAVQLPKSILIYQQTPESSVYDLSYTLIKRVQYDGKTLECNLLVVTKMHLILCQERRLQLFDFRGVKVREWTLDATIRYIKIIGGAPGREGLLVALKSGAVYKIFIDNHFPILIVTHKLGVRCVDLNASRQKLALVDEKQRVYVYDMATREVLFEDDNANSVSWNTDFDDMFCYSGNNQLSIKTGDFPVHRQRLQGFVVGFSGSKIFCLHALQMKTIDVPQSPGMYQYLARKEYSNAYKVACLGVTETDWRELASQALAGLETTIARKAFVRTRDVRSIELLERVELERGDPDHSEAALRADILAFQGDSRAAAKEYVRAGQGRKAVEMLLDLRDWKAAQELVESLGESGGGGGETGGVDMKDLLKRQAQWLVETGDFKAAADMYWGAREYDAAIQILGERGWLDDLVAKIRRLDNSKRQELSLAAEFFEKNKHHAFANEIYLKIDDVEKLMRLHIRMDKWQEAFALAKENPRYARGMFLPYAKWLAVNDRFEEAQRAFRQAGSPGQSLRLLQQLTTNAVSEQRFDDAGYYFWLLAQEHLTMAGEAGDDAAGRRAAAELIGRYKRYSRQSRLYSAYATVYDSEKQPFTELAESQIFDTALYLLRELATGGEGKVASRQPVPCGISVAMVLFALAKHARAEGIEAFKLARKVYQRLLTLNLPPKWRREVEVGALTIRTKPFTDKEELTCHRCRSSNPLLSARGSRCVVCGHEFVYSAIGWDVLPLVEFQLDEGISDAEAARLMAALPEGGGNGGSGGAAAVQFTDDGEAETMTFGADEPEPSGVDDAPGGEDAFVRQLLRMDHGTSTEWPLITVDARTLEGFHPKEVFAVSSADPRARTRYFKMVNASYAEYPIVQCKRSQYLYSGEDYEAYALQHARSPICRLKLPEYASSRNASEAELDPLAMADSGFF